MEFLPRKSPVKVFVLALTPGEQSFVLVETRKLGLDVGVDVRRPLPSNQFFRCLLLKVELFEKAVHVPAAACIPLLQFFAELKAEFLHALIPYSIAASSCCACAATYTFTFTGALYAFHDFDWVWFFAFVFDQADAVLEEGHDLLWRQQQRVLVWSDPASQHLEQLPVGNLVFPPEGADHRLPGVGAASRCPVRLLVDVLQELLPDLLFCHMIDLT